MLESFDRYKDTSLYIHIPFCSKKCSYCAFYSVVSDENVYDKFTKKLILEIKEANNYFSKPWDTIFIGGGNPGIIGFKNLLKIAETAVEKGKPREFSIEINPETLTESFFPLFSIINRLSMGIQSLNSDSLNFLGRNSTYDETINGIVLSSKLNIEKSYDLITCLPKNINTTINDIDKLIKLSSFNHLSVYSLTPEENTPMWRNRKILPNDDIQYEMLSHIWEYLEKKGFEHYEVSNFAKNDKKCIHNCNYWQLKQYIGLGPAACSTAFSNQTKRWSGVKNVEKYILNDIFTIYKPEILSHFEEMEEFILVGLRTKRGIKKSEFYERFHIELPDLNFPGFINANDGIIVQNKGLMLSDAAALALIELCPST